MSGFLLSKEHPLAPYRLAYSLVLSALLLMALPRGANGTGVNFWGEGIVGKGKITVNLTGPPAETDEEVCTNDNCYCPGFYLYTPTNTADLKPWTVYTISISGPGCPGPTNSIIRYLHYESTNSCYPISRLTNWTDDGGTLHEEFIIMTSNVVVFDRCCLPADTNYTVSAGVAGTPYPTISPPFVWTINDPNLGCKVNQNGVVAGAPTNGTITVRAMDTNTGCYAEGTIDLCDLGTTMCPGTCGPDSIGPGSNNGGGSGSGGGGAGSGGSGGAGGGGSGGSGGSGGGSGTIGSVSGTLSTSGGLSVGMGMGMTTGALPLTSAGAIRIGAAVPSWTLYSPAGLFFYYAVTAVAVITNNNGIVQVHSPDGLGNVVTNSSTNSYEVDFYAPSNVTGFSGGLYLFTNSPFATVTISNPDNGTTNNRVRVTAVKDTVTSIYDFVYTNSAWQLTSGGGLRTETVSVTATNGIRTMTRQLLSSGSVIYQNVKQFQTFSWGEGLIEEDIGTGPSALTNSYSYYTNGLLQQVNHANGSWEYYVYDDQRRATNVFSSFGNQAPTTDKSLCRMVEYNYSTNVVAGSGDPGTTDIFTPRRTVEYLLGQEISRSYAVRNWGSQADYRCQTAGAAWDASDNLITSTVTFTSGADFGKPQMTWRNDSLDAVYGNQLGTYDLYYYDNVGSNNPVYTVYTASGALDPTAFDPVIYHGTSNATSYGASGEILATTNYAIVDNLNVPTPWLTGLTVYSNFDAYRRPLQTTYLDGSSEFTFYDCCNLDIFTNREGTVTTYGYDALKRRITTTVNGIMISNKLDGAGNVLAVVRYGTNGSSMTLRSATYDNAGRLKSSTDGVGNVTSYTNFFDSNGYLVRQTTLPNSAITTNMYYRDGSLYKIAGSAVFPKTYLYGVGSDGGSLTSPYTLEQRDTTNEWVKTFTDMVGRQYKTVYATGSGSNPSTQNYYTSYGKLWKSVDLDGVVSLYTYDDIGALVDQGIDMNGDNTFSGASKDRLTAAFTYYTQNSGVDVGGTITYTWPILNNASSIAMSDIQSSTDGHQIWSTSYGLTTHTTTYLAGNGIRVTTNTAPDGSFTITTNSNGLLISMNRFDANGGQISGTSYGYDAHGRRSTATDARCGTTTYTFDNADRVTSITTPSPSQTTSNLYNNLGQISKTILPDSTFFTNGYFDNGLLKQTYGSRTYPVAYKYDSQGRMTNMTTWTNFTANQGAATTTWKYDGYRGFMTNKVYADGNGPSYVYTNSGKILQRTWARGVTTSYGYNNAGDLLTTVYSDGTPNVTNTMDRLGRATTIKQGTNISTLVYADAGQLLSETFNGVTVTNIYDSLNRRITNGVVVGGTWLTMTTNSYDAASRLLVVSDRTNSATYSYLTNSPLVSQILFQQSGTTRMTTTKQYDNLNRLLAITNLPSADSAIVFNYTYNSANQRTSVTNADRSRWIYQYDSLGEVISGKKYWSDGTPVAGQQFEYGYDDIGNRKYAGSGGDQWGANLRYENYTVNNLNQYTQRTVPGAVDILGAANSNATVTVNNTPSYRKGEYFRNQFPIANGSSSVYQAFTNLAVLANGTNADFTVTNVGNLFLAMTPEAFGFDLGRR